MDTRRLYRTSRLGLAVACVAALAWLPGCGESDPGEGTFGRFRLLNRHKIKKVTDIRIYRRTKSGQTYSWNEITDELSDDSWSATEPMEYHLGSFKDGELHFTYGVKVDWKMEGESDWRHAQVDESDFGTSGRAVRLVLLTVRSGCEGAGHLQVLMGDSTHVHEANAEGLGRFRVENMSGKVLDWAKLYKRVDDSGGNKVWVGVSGDLIDDDGSLIKNVTDGTYYAGHAPAHFEDVHGVKVEWSIENAPQELFIDENTAPFDTNSTAVFSSTLMLQGTNAALHLQLPGNNVVLKTP